MQYLYYYFYFLDFKEFIKDGLGRNKLTQGNLRRINIRIPSDKELNEFASYVEEIDKLKFDDRNFKNEDTEKLIYGK